MTSTACETITACSAEATTTTTTIDNDKIPAVTPLRQPVASLNTATAHLIAVSLDSYFSSLYNPPVTTTTADPSITTSEASSTPSQDWSRYEPEVSTTCGGPELCLSGAAQYKQCDQSRDLIVDTDLYTT